MTNMPTPTIVDFLLARIAEDEAVGQAVRDAHDPFPWTDDQEHRAAGLLGPVDGPSGYESIIVDPARVLAECEAKRRIVERAAVTTHLDYDARWAQAEALRDLATVYAAHPDYNPDWRP